MGLVSIANKADGVLMSHLKSECDCAGGQIVEPCRTAYDIWTSLPWDQRGKINVEQKEAGA